MTAAVIVTAAPSAASVASLRPLSMPATPAARAAVSALELSDRRHDLVLLGGARVGRQRQAGETRAHVLGHQAVSGQGSETAAHLGEVQRHVVEGGLDAPRVEVTQEGV